MTMLDGIQTQALADADIASFFPSNFLWGAATSSYQIEGATREDGRGMSIWDHFSTLPGAIAGGETGDVAVDYYHRWPADIALMKELGFNSYCFSIAWPRILPDGSGPVNEKGLDFYERLIDNLLAQGITPCTKLYHWDLPQALQEKGGWENRDTAYLFAEYAEIVARRLGDRVPYWITHNEPWCASFLGYGIGVHAPGIRENQWAVQAAHHLLLSHGLAIPRLRAHVKPDAQLGITLNLYPVYPADDRPETQKGVAWVDAFKNRWFLDPIFRASYPQDFFEEFGVQPPVMLADDLTTISAPIDFLGVNYYSRTLVRGRTEEEVQEHGGSSKYEEVAGIPSSDYTAMGWEVYPQGLSDILMRINRDYAPPAIMITENGAAFNDELQNGSRVHDAERTSYLREHISSVANALANGVPMKGYFAWSLMDNFEWSEGYSKRFGIVYVDYPTQQRIVKDSGRWYSSFLTSQSAT